MLVWLSEAHHTNVLLNSSHPEEWNAWKHHYCTRTCLQSTDGSKCYSRYNENAQSTNGTHTTATAHTFCGMDLLDSNNRLCSVFSEVWLILQVKGRGKCHFIGKTCAVKICIIILWLGMQLTILLVNKSN